MALVDTERADGSQKWDAALYDHRHAFVWQHGQSLVALLAPQRGERILDLGCGTGHLTAQIAASGADVIGLDHSAEMLDQARAAYPNLDFVAGDARDFSFTSPFDAVFSNAMLHWIQDPAAVACCVHACLHPGGRFVAEFGGHGNVATIIAAMHVAAGRIGMPLDEPLWYYPSIGEYAALLEAHGLETRTAVLFARPTPLDGAQGLRDWLAMFGRRVLDRVPAAQREDFFQAVEDAARPTLFREQRWIADYRRLRITAVRAG